MPSVAFAFREYSLHLQDIRMPTMDTMRHQRSRPGKQQIHRTNGILVVLADV